MSVWGQLRRDKVIGEKKRFLRLSMPILEGFNSIIKCFQQKKIFNVFLGKQSRSSATNSIVARENRSEK